MLTNESAGQLVSQTVMKIIDSNISRDKMCIFYVLLDMYCCFAVYFSADFEQRENEKKRIEKAFKECDKNLGVLVKGTFLLYIFCKEGICILVC